MDEKLNELLVQEIRKSIESLEHDKAQINAELEELAKKNEKQISTELSKDLENVEKEIDQKQDELRSFDVTEKNIDVVEKELQELSTRYDSLLKDKNDYEAKLREIDGRLELKDGKYVPTVEVMQAKQDLEKINNEINLVENLKSQKDIELETNKNLIKNLLAKYNINEKMVEKEEIKQQEDDMWEQYRKEQEDEKNRQIDEAYADKEKEEREEERKILQATRKEIIHHDLDLNAEELQKPSSQQPTQSQPQTPAQRPATQSKAQQASRNPQTMPQGQTAQPKPQQGTQNPIVNPNLPGLKIVYDRANNTYVMTDESKSYDATYHFQSTYLKNKSKERVVEDIEKQRGKEFTVDIAQYIDCNLYYCLARYDRETGSNKATEYIESLEKGKQDIDLDVTYNLKGARRLNILDDFRQKRIATKSANAIGAKVEKDENKIVKAIKNLFKRVKTTSLPYPEMQLEDGKDIHGQEIPSKDLDEKEAFSSRIKVNQYSKPEIASYVNAYMTRGEQTEEKDINATNKAEYLQQLREEGLSEREITEISEKIEMQEGKNNQSREMNR